MYELIAKLVTQIYGMWRFRWYTLLVAWITALAGCVLVYSLPDEYKAQAKVVVDTNSNLRPLLQGLAVRTDVMNEVRIMTRTLLSTPHLERVATETGLDLHAKTPSDKKAIANQLRARITIERDDNNLYAISYVDADKAMAQSVVQSLLTSFVEDTLGANRTGATNAQLFLEKQIRDYEQKLATAEERLAAFKQENLGLMPDEGQDYYARLQGAMRERDDTRQRLQIVNRRRNELIKQVEGEEPMLGIVAPRAVEQTAPPSKYDARIERHRQELDDLLLKYTHRHPDVQALEATIAVLEAMREEEVPVVVTPQAAAQPRPLEQSPVYQSMRIALSQAEVEASELQTVLKAQERKVRGLKKLVNTIPEVEAELTRLNRDYEINQTQYEALVKRLEYARLSEQADQESDDIKFRIIEPPVEPLYPSGPLRELFIIVVAVGSLMLGIALSFFLNQIKPVFWTVRSVSESLGVPVLATVTRVVTPARRAYRFFELTSFSLGVAVLLAALSGAYVFQVRATSLVQNLLMGGVM
jgi:polysaccharide chain length determinant protein (PEP-CTERM system associated)